MTLQAVISCMTAQVRGQSVEGLHSVTWVRQSTRGCDKLCGAQDGYVRISCLSPPHALECKQKRMKHCSGPPGIIGVGVSMGKSAVRGTAEQQNGRIHESCI